MLKLSIREKNPKKHKNNQPPSPNHYRIQVPDRHTCFVNPLSYQKDRPEIFC